MSISLEAELREVGALADQQESLKDAREGCGKT